MKPNVIELLCDPIYKTKLKVERKGGLDYLISNEGMVYPIVDDIPVLLQKQEVSDLNKRNMDFYDKMAKWCGGLEGFAENLMGLDEKREIWTNDINIKEGDLVLEVGIGTGRNTKFLTPNAYYFGIDISRQMLKRCKENMRKWGQEVELFQAVAQQLPFIDKVFDVVYHIGGIKLFADIASAIREMIRVTRPGGRIIIIDANEGYIEDFYRKIPILSNYYFKINQEEMETGPVFYYIPSTMDDLEVKDIAGGTMYQVSFIKSYQ